MSISRVFRNLEDANSAVSDLKALGFRAADIQVVAPPGTSEGFPDGTKVIVFAPLGSAGKATKVLEKTRAHDNAPVKSVYDGWLPPRPKPPNVILLDDPAPLSGLLFIPLLVKSGKGLFEALGLPSLSQNGTILSSLFKIPLLLKD